MTLDPGIAAVGVGVCGTIIAAIVKFGPAKNGGGFVSKDLFEERTRTIFQSLGRIETKLDAHIAHSEET